MSQEHQGHDMPLGTAFLRIVTALILSIPVLLGFCYYLGAIALQNTILQATYVTTSIEDSALYDRIYDELLIDSDFDRWTDNLVGNFQVSDKEKVQLLREVIPPHYVQGETERNLTTLVSYLKNERNELDVFIDLRSPIASIKPVVFAFLDTKIDGLESVPVSSRQALEQEIAVFLARVANGQIPSHIPTMSALSASEWSKAYEGAFDSLARNPSLSDAAISNLQQQEQEILASVQPNDVTTALKLASHAIAEPFIDEAINSLRENANELDHVDLVEQVAEDSDRTRSEVIRDANTLRTVLVFGTGTVALWTALGIVALGTLLIAVVFVPYWKHVFFWPSAILMVTGLLTLVSGLFFAADVQIWVSAVCQNSESPSCGLVLDVARAVASGIGADFLMPSLTMILTAAVGFLISTFISTFLSRRRT